MQNQTHDNAPAPGDTRYLASFRIAAMTGAFV